MDARPTRLTALVLQLIALSLARAQEPAPPPPPAVESPKEAPPQQPADAYRPYPGHDVAKAFEPTTEPDGGKRIRIDMRRLVAILDDLEYHAQNYPPTFRDEIERKLATRDASQVGQVLQVILRRDGGPEARADILLFAGRLEAVGHNLDVEGSSTRAVDYFERLLQVDPEHVEGHLRFGNFLGATATLQRQAQPHLEKALQLGETRAHRSLALLNLMLGDKDAAIEHLSTYVQLHPDDTSSAELLEALENVETKIEHRVDEPPTPGTPTPEPPTPETPPKRGK